MGDFKDLLDKHTMNKTLVNMFSATAHKNDDGLLASHDIALPISKVSKYEEKIGETLITPFTREVITTVPRKGQEPVLRALSNSTVHWRINEIISDAERNVCNILLYVDFIF